MKDDLGAAYLLCSLDVALLVIDISFLFGVGRALLDVVAACNSLFFDLLRNLDPMRLGRLTSSQMIAGFFSLEPLRSMSVMV